MADRETSMPKMPPPAFSVVMPAYNAASTIDAAIESVLSQTRPDFELLIVDDGSTDNTAARAQSRLRDDRLRLLSQPNRGKSSARNAGVQAARGALVSFLDSDDLWLPQYLEVMAATLGANPTAAVAYTDAWLLDDESRRIARSSAMSPWHPPTVPSEPGSFLRALLRFGNFVFGGATVRRSTLGEVGGFRVELDGAEDFELWLRIAANGYRLVRCPTKLAIYRRSSGQATADPEMMRRFGNEVFRIVAEDYEIPDELRDLARQRLPMREPVRRARRRWIPRPLRPPLAALSRARRFYIRPPLQIRQAFPDLRSL
jgi:glycosyltransferase involved in cell wall biosynthesis